MTINKENLKSHQKKILSTGAEHELEMVIVNIISLIRCRFVSIKQ